MTARPLAFSTSMVRALREGRKTQTRRVVQLNDAERVRRAARQWHLDDPNATLGCPYGQSGDLLWVREHCATWEGEHRDVVYRADVDDGDWQDLLHDRRIGAPWSVRGSRYMPRWASRMTLLLTNVSLERVQEITGEDAIEEGSYLGRCACGVMRCNSNVLDAAFRQEWCIHHGTEFRFIWDSINAKRGHGWDTNPWVWVLAFETIHRNVDDILSASQQEEHQ